MKSPSRRFIVIALSVLLCDKWTTVYAQSNFFEGQNIRIIVGLAAGGGYDVYARVMRYGKSIEMEKPVAVAASGNFEARSSAAFDRQGRLWVAFESADQRWGKDFGVYDRKGICLYLGHTVRMKVLEGNRAFETEGSLADALRSVPGRRPPGRPVDTERDRSETQRPTTCRRGS